MEEVGELSRLVARTYGDQSFKKSDLEKNIPSEMGDVLFVLICLANQMGISLEDALKQTIEKNTTRYPTAKERDTLHQRLESYATNKSIWEDLTLAALSTQQFIFVK